MTKLVSLMTTLAPATGVNATATPDVVLYRFDAPTGFRKSPARGVSVGVIVQGEKRARIGAQELTLGAGQLVLVTSETQQASSITIASRDRPYFGVHLSFSPQRVARALLACREAGAADLAAGDALRMRVDRPLAGALHRLVSMARTPLDASLYAPLVLEEILLRLLQTEVARPLRQAAWREPNAEKIVEAMSWAESHIGEALTVERLAARVGMSPSHFAHRFRDVARMSPMRYVRELRLDRARTLLRTHRVSEVAGLIGYESSSHFSREFTRRFGVAPGRFARAADT